VLLLFPTSSWREFGRGVVPDVFFRGGACSCIGEVVVWGDPPLMTEKAFGVKKLFFTL